MEIILFIIALFLFFNIIKALTSKKHQKEIDKRESILEHQRKNLRE